MFELALRTDSLPGAGDVVRAAEQPRSGSVSIQAYPFRGPRSMLVTDPAVRSANARPDLNAGVRYAVVRLAELCDPDSPFALSGCAYCDPLAAVRAFESAARDHLANPGVRHGTVLAASQLLSDALEQEGNLRQWYPGDLTRLLVFLAQLRKVPSLKTVGERQVKVPYHERTTWVRQKLGALVSGSLARFHAALSDEATGYRSRLLDGLCSRLCEAPATERDWAELDHDLCYLSALLLDEGRDGGEVVRAVAAAVAAAPDSPSAVRALLAAVSRPRGCYEVALALAGARSLARSSAGAFGVEVVDRDDVRWPGGAGAPAQRALAAFLADRVPAGESAALVARVEAWDGQHARLRAVGIAQAVCDHLVAEHPDGHFSVAPETLVLDLAAGRARRLGAGRPALREGRPVRAEGAEELLPFLRANALARGESSPVLRILHTWVALEYVAREGAANGDGGGAGRTGFSPRLESYLPPHLASVAALAGLRAQLVASWDAVRALALRSEQRAAWLQVEAWLGVSRGRPRSLTRLVGLLRALGDPAPAAPADLAPDAPAPVAAAFLLRVAAGTGPFAGRRLEALGRQYDRGSRLAKAAEAIQVRTLIAIARLKLARHLALHQGFNGVHASAPLALSAVQVVGSAFEVLRLWMTPGCRAWDALSGARRWHEANLAAWRSATELEVDADHLLHPMQK
jgi:hypothetical protein